MPRFVERVVARLSFFADLALGSAGVIFFSAIF
jgi:hypothetical protein